MRGDRVRTLGVTEFGQGSSVSDAYRLHGIDAESITSAALDLLHRVRRGECCSTHEYMATAAAADALIERVEPYLSLIHI